MEILSTHMRTDISGVVNPVRRAARKAMPVLAAAMVLFAFSAPLFSQASSSAIQGAVFDQSHGVVPNATVTVIDVARGAQRDLMTDSAGEYTATNLIPGMYTVRATAKGFQTVQQANVLLEVGQTVRVDLTLMPGEQTQTVTVSSEAPAVDTSDAQFGGTVSNDLVTAIPLNGRNFSRLMELRPGIVATSVGGATGVFQYTNGRVAGDDLYRFEGMASICQTQMPVDCINSSYRGGDSGSLIPLDSIQEFNTEQNPKAEDGWKEGSFVSVGLKSGTNAIHGTAFAFGRDALATDAANAFTRTITPATVQQFGGTVGGPILKDKLFWFAGYEGLRDSLADTAVVTIPVDISLANIAGNGAAGNVGTSMVDACRALGTKNINPLSAELAGLNPTTCVVSPASSTFENLFPFNATTSANYNPVLNPNGPLDNGIFKADYIPGPHHHIGFTFFDAEGTQTSNNNNTQLEPQWMIDIHDDAKMYVGTWTWAPNSTWVNNFILGLNYYDNSTFAGDVNMLPSNPWPSGYGMPTGVTNPVYGGLPTITFTSFTGALGANSLGGASIRGPEGDLDLVDNISYLHGKHAFKFGFEYIDIVDDEGLRGNIGGALEEGAIKFGAATNPLPPLEQFLEGVTNGGSVLLGDATSEFRSHWYAGFFQDDFRIKPRVVLNMGIRYEIEMPMTERNNYLGNFNPNVNPATTPAIQQVGPGEPIPSLFHEGKTNFSPRLGVAWDIAGNGKTVLRGSISLLTDYISLFQLGNGKAVPFGANFPCLVAAAQCTSSANSVNTSGTALNAHTPAQLTVAAATLNAGWNLTGPIFPIAATQLINGVNYSGSTCNVVGEGTGAQCTTFALDPNIRQPHAAEWSLDLQRAITNSLTLDVAYVGNYGFDEISTYDLNQPTLGIGWTTSTATAGAVPCAASLNLTALTASCTSNTAVETGFYSSQFPYLKYINYTTNGAISYYDALQVIANQRMSHGLSFLVGYTWSHGLADSYGPNLGNYRANLGNGLSDIRNRLSVSPSYLVPGIKSPGQMLQGWSVSGVVTAQGGLPWSPSDTTDDLTGTGEFNNTATQTWNYQGPKSAFTTGNTPFPCYGPISGCTPFSATPTSVMAECENAAIAPYAPGSTLPGTTASLQMLALAAFTKYGCYVTKGGTLARGGGVLTAPAYGTLGNAVNSLFRGPGYFNVDMSVAKIWTFKERYSAQFRAEFFNLFNRADYIAAPTGTNPASGPGSQFGCSCTTPDAPILNPNPVLGAGGARHIQFGLKLIF